ncbi:Cyclin-dependent kinase-like 1, partial [Tetrabaena socialis]
AHEDAAIMRLAVREARVLQAVSHPNLIRMLAVFKSKSGRLHMVFELAGLSLHKLLNRSPTGLAPVLTRVVAWQLLHAVAYLHDNKILHRDIKPANVLLADDGVVKLCDFGFARHTRCGPREAAQGTSYVVTRWYRAPEILVSDDYGPAADVWSVGCTLAEIATGRPLFPGASSADQLWRIMRCRGPLPPQQAACLAAQERFCERIGPTPKLHKTLQQRLPEPDSALFGLLEACLRLDPAQRPTARELLQLPYFTELQAPIVRLPAPLAAMMRSASTPVATGAAAASLQLLLRDLQEPQQVQQQQQRPQEAPLVVAAAAVVALAAALPPPGCGL